ncbi:hypothetical protein AB8810_13410 [Xanthomonas sp. NCPPB 3005]|jgi:hypothetical protein|uniref:hypothetical protein n=1 Tax=Xanthomonas sp. NCPPB 3005 TaxID=3240913 RepID=UPI0035183CDA
MDAFVAVQRKAKRAVRLGKLTRTGFFEWFLHETAQKRVIICIYITNRFPACANFIKRVPACRCPGRQAQLSWRAHLHHVVGRHVQHQHMVNFLQAVYLACRIRPDDLVQPNPYTSNSLLR